MTITDFGIETPLDEFDSIREYFDDDQWELIYDALLAESSVCSEDDIEKYNVILRKVQTLFDITGEIDRC